MIIEVKHDKFCRVCGKEILPCEVCCEDNKSTQDNIKN